MADETHEPPKPRPRRRRTDIDPNAPSPPVANERRRERLPTADAGPDGAPLATAAALDAMVDGPGESVGPAEEATTVFHVPGMAVAATAASVAAVAGEGIDAAGAAIGRAGDGPSAVTAAASGGAALGVADREVEPRVEEPQGLEPQLVEPLPVVEDVVPGLTSDGAPTWLAVLDDRSPDPKVCPFLRATRAGSLIAPFEQPDPANRCAALAEAVPQSLRQQELVCLTTGHVNCPRYLRGAAVMTETPKPVVRERQPMSLPMLISLVALVIAITASVGFVFARGGALSIGPGGSPGASQPVAVGSPSPVSLAPSISPSLLAEATPTPAPTPSPTPTTTPTPTPSPTPTPTPRPTRTPRPTPSSDRYALLTACPNTPRCWIYTVRRGDNVFSIAHYFGVSTDAVYSRNPWLRTSGLRAGQQLRLPPPTR